MSLNNSNKIVTNGLVMALDGGNLKSFPGEPTTNIINSVTNTYPKVGNGWGTYNTNQYNNGNYFSIGTISGVSNNEVTTAAAHPLRTYDVVRPQTSGGGLTAGTDYYIKKTSSTTFTVHSYDGTENGSKGFEVLRPIRNDTRISINSTSFPTMWWGSPHLGNSGLIKTIIPNAFNGHECIRLNWYRPDGVTDGMAYNVSPAVTGGQTYTFSAYYKAASASAIGNSVYWQIYYDGNQTSGILGYMYPTDKWQRFVATTTANATGTVYSYWFPNTGQMAMDMSEIQIEAKSYATNFTPTSRSTTNCLLDLSGNSFHASTFNNPVYSSLGNGSISLNGSNQYLTIPDSAKLNIGTTGHTENVWIRPSTTGNQRITFKRYGALGYGYSLYISGGIFGYEILTPSTYIIINGPSVSANTWYNICVVIDRYSTSYMYVNGVQVASADYTSFSALDITNTYPLTLGAVDSTIGGGAYFNGVIGSVSMYDRTLSRSEVLQNFNANRRRFGV